MRGDDDEYPARANDNTRRSHLRSRRRDDDDDDDENENDTNADDGRGDVDLVSARWRGVRRRRRRRRRRRWGWIIDVVDVVDRRIARYDDDEYGAYDAAANFADDDGEKEESGEEGGDACTSPYVEGYALPRVDESKATIKVKSDNCELRVKIKIIYL